MADTVRIAFIGCGGHATNTHYPNLTACPEAELVACCDLVEEKARGNAERFGVPHWYTDYDEMLGQHEVDAVFVVGPPQMHTEIGLEMLDRGYHVFTEKPTATTVGDGKRMAEAAAASEKLTQVGHMLPHGPATKVAKSVMASGEFGKAIFCESKYFVPGPRRIIWDAPTLDWTFMLVQSVHPVDWLRHVMGDVDSVACSRGTGENGAVSYVVACDFADGACGLLNLTSSAPHVVAQMELVGDKGTFISIDNMIRIRYEGAAWGFPVEHDYGGREAGYFEEVQDFCRAILDGQPAYPTWEDEYQALLTCEAICRSIDSGGERVNVAEAGND